MNLESELWLDKFQCRWYQKDLWNAIEKQGYRKVIAVLPRRAGKDITCWNLAIRQCLRKVCLVYYALPTYGQARKTVFDAITIDGLRFLDFVPKQLVESINVSEMKIRFINGSILQCIGADSYETSLVGTNPYAIIFSEYARCHPKAYEYARPILAANLGWCVMLTTPFGKNHAWQLFKIAQDLPDWKVIYKKTSEIQHISPDILQQERAQMSEELYMQEYECSFERGVEGSYYGKLLENLKQLGHICSISYEPGLQVHTAWDIGVNDATTILWFQVIGDGAVIKIIDCYSSTGVGLDHYIKKIQEKPYVYGKHFAPHDIKVREWGGGAISRFEKAAQLGLIFTLLDQIGLHDGIENVMTHFNKIWINEDKCKTFINALENYRREWDEEKQMYDNKPVKNWACHYADSFRYLCMAIYKTKKGLSPVDYDRIKAQALYGGSNDLPRFFDPKYNNLR